MSAPPIRAEFSLVDHHGRPVTEQTHRGSWQLVQFGFTSCRVVCPRALTRLSDALEQLDTAVGSAPVDRDVERDDGSGPDRGIELLYVTVGVSRSGSTVT